MNSESEKFEEEKRTLIDLIEWYRDSYYNQDFVYNEMIYEIKKSTISAQLETYWKITDGWLDY